MVEILNQDRVNKAKSKIFKQSFSLAILFLLFFSETSFSQNLDPAAGTPPPSASNTSTITTPQYKAPENAADPDDVEETTNREMKNLIATPDKRRIRRHLSLVLGVKSDEELLIPNVPLSIRGPYSENVDIQRIKNTDIFRILPAKVGSGIVTIHNRKTGQIYVELHLDVRDGVIDKTIRELKALLIDVDGIEYKSINGGVVLDGYVILPQDLIRISNVIKNLGTQKDQSIPAVNITSLVTLSPISRKRIIDYISREANNPEVTITSVGDYVKLEGTVNSQTEKDRIENLVKMYLPNYVVNKVSEGVLDNVNIVARTITGSASNFIVNMIEVRKQEEQEPPPPKMIQVVVHFVEFSESFSKWFSFMFSPSLSTLASGGSAQAAPTTQTGGTNTTINSAQPTATSDFVNLVNNLIPKLNWGKFHGYLRVLDTGSILVKDKGTGTINRQVQVGTGSDNNGGNKQEFNITVTPTISQPRSGLIDMHLDVKNSPLISVNSTSTSITTDVSVRDRQSAAFGGIINKGTNNSYGLPRSGQNGAGAILNMNAAKSRDRINSNSVVFVTPIIKTSASAGVEQVKKKFRLKE